MVEDLPGEVWKNIHETHDRYAISNRGRFRHYKNGLCNLKRTKSGILYLHVKIDSKDYSFYQYRTMYKYFISDKISNNYQVLLKDNCELKPENLYLVSYKKSNRVYFGKKVYVYDTDLSLISIFNSCAEAAEQLSVGNRSSIARACNNKVSHVSNYIFSYTELSIDDLVCKLNSIILSYFNQCHKYSKDVEIIFNYSDIGVITSIKVSRTFSYKKRDDETQTIIFYPKKWLKHNNIIKKYCTIKAEGKLKPSEHIPSIYSEQHTLNAYVYDGLNARFLFYDTIYNTSKKLKCSSENVRYHIKETETSYVIVNKMCYVIYKTRDDNYVKEFVRNNIPPCNFFKDKDIRRRYYGILSRLHCKTQSRYQYYGGKGITMFDDWEKDGREFEYFCIKHGFKKDLEIDRINPDFGYEPWNIQFISGTDNKKKIFTDNNRTKLQIRIDKVKYFRRKHNFLKNYKKGDFVNE